MSKIELGINQNSMLSGGIKLCNFSVCKLQWNNFKQRANEILADYLLAFKKQLLVQEMRRCLISIKGGSSY